MEALAHGERGQRRWHRNIRVVSSPLFIFVGVILVGVALYSHRLVNLQERLRQLQEWSMDLNLPKAVWLSGLFNPQAFLTAIMQVGPPPACSLAQIPSITSGLALNKDQN